MRQLILASAMLFLLYVSTALGAQQQGTTQRPAARAAALHDLEVALHDLNIDARRLLEIVERHLA